MAAAVVSLDNPYSVRGPDRLRGPNDIDHPWQIKYLDQKARWIDCPFCKARTQTRVTVKKTKMTAGM
jgi:hypothetical protein